MQTPSSPISTPAAQKVLICQHPRRTATWLIDREMYKWRHVMANFFAKLKEFKRIAMRADKTDQSFLL